MDEPDAVGGGSRSRPLPTIWRYGELELHFDGGEDGGLRLLYLESPAGVPVLTLGSLTTRGVREQRSPKGRVEERVNFGIDRFDPDRKISLPLQDALFVFKTLQEYVRFFHQPLNWPSIEDVREFVGTTRHGALRPLFESYYDRMYDVWPPDVSEAIDQGLLDPDGV